MEHEEPSGPRPADDAPSRSGQSHRLADPVHPARPHQPDVQRFLFPRQRRLSRSGEFHLVKEQGETFKGRYMVLGVLGRGEAGWRVGIITTRRLGKAVDRNRVRRRFRELARLALPAMEEKGAWLVVVARRAAIDAPWDALRHEWEKLLRRAALKPAPLKASGGGERAAGKGEQG